MTRLTPRPDGIRIRLEPGEIGALTDLAGQVQDLLAGGVPEPGADAIRGRLFPRAYLDPTEDTAESDFQSVVHADLVAAKAQATTRLIEDLGGVADADGGIDLDLDVAGVEQWAMSLNDVRLAIGVALGVTEDDADDEIDDDDPRAEGLATYDWLTWLQSHLIEILLDDLGEEPG